MGIGRSLVSGFLAILDAYGLVGIEVARWVHFRAMIRCIADLQFLAEDRVAAGVAIRLLQRVEALFGRADLAEDSARFNAGRLIKRIEVRDDGILHSRSNLFQASCWPDCVRGHAPARSERGGGSGLVKAPRNSMTRALRPMPLLS